VGSAVVAEDASLPLVLAPTGFTRMMHHSGERGVAAAAARAGVPYALSTAGTTSPEDLMMVEPSGVRWFQLYLWRDRGRAKALVDRVAEAGFRTLVLTVDTPAAGDRRRDVRNANAFAERWVGSVRRECLDHVLIFGRRHLQRVLGAYTEHYNRARPHRALDLHPPDPTSSAEEVAGSLVRRRDLLGGLIHEFDRAAA
jgi:FMN-dependent dehydrogenase/Integrase core domain